MAQVFISYSRKDLAFVEQLANDLKNAGFDVWYDISGIRGGSRWRAEIENAVRNSQFALVVLSPDSIVSEWVEREFLFASNLKRKIIPLYYRQSELPLNYLDLNYIDVQGDNYRKNFGKILRALQQPAVSPLLENETAKSSSRPVYKKKSNTVLVLSSIILAAIGLAIGSYLVVRGNLPTPPPATTAPILTSPEPSQTLTPSLTTTTENATSTYTPTESSTPTSAETITPSLTITNENATSTYTPTQSITPTPTETITPSLTITDTVPPPPVFTLNYAHQFPMKLGGPDRGRNVGRVECPMGYLITGLFGNQGDNITGIGLRCSLLNSDGTTGAATSSQVVGQNGGPHWQDLDCPPNMAVSGVGVFSGSYIDQVRAVCSYINGDRSYPYRTAWVGSGGKENPEGNCTSDYFVTGFELKWGDYLDGITAICTEVLRK